MSTKLTATLLRGTWAPVHRGVKREDHCYYVWRDYVNQSESIINRHSSTISRRMRGLTLPPWEVVSYYAGEGTRCPEALVDGLRQYISDRYYSRTHREGLRAALLETLDDLPPEDAEDIRSYWHGDSLAHMWAVLQWYCLCEDYSNKHWNA